MAESLMSEGAQEVFKMAEQENAEGEVDNQKAREKSNVVSLSTENPAYITMQRAQEIRRVEEAKDADEIRSKLGIPTMPAGNPPRVHEARRGTMDAQVHE